MNDKRWDVNEKEKDFQVSIQVETIQPLEVIYYGQI
jgi:hypothetical protein